MSRSLWARLRQRRDVEREMAEEMQFHVETRTEELMRRDPALAEWEARRRARIEFGCEARYREEARSAMGFRPFDELTADVRYAIRGFRHRPGFAVVAVVVLGLASGANTAFFGFYNNYLLRPLPIRAAERHYQVEAAGDQGRTLRTWSESELAQLREAGSAAWEGLYAERTRQAAVMAPDAVKAFVSSVSENYFELLGGRPVMGRVFRSGDDSDRHTPVTVLSESGWRRLLRGEPDPVGRTIRIRDTTFTVIGVTEPRFTGTAMTVPDAWIPLEYRRVLVLEEQASEARYTVAGILRDGATPMNAAAALHAVATRMERVKEERVHEVRLRLTQAAGDSEDGLAGAAQLVATTFLLVLLIACANLAGLQLARAASRSHEMSVRLSLGASRARIVRQLLTESCVLSFAGAGLGLVLALGASPHLHGYLFSQMAQFGIVVAPVSADWRVFAYSMLLALAGGLAFGLLPALQATAMALAPQRGHSVFMGRVKQHRLRDLLLSGQVAASLVLLVLGGLMVRNTQRLGTAEPGFDLDRVMDLRFPEKVTPKFVERLRQEPLLEQVSAAGRAPLMGWMPRIAVTVAGQTTVAQFNPVDDRYFDALGLHAVRGRAFTRQDLAPGSRAIVISEATARRLWPQADAVGKTLHVQAEGEGPAAGAREVVGVVPDVMSGLVFLGKDRTMIYFPAEAGAPELSTIVVRARGGDVGAVKAALNRYCADHEPPALCHTFTMREATSLQLFPFQAAALIAGGLGALALGLTCIGLFGVVSYNVAQRTKEIGIRMAIGATPGHVVRQLLREALVRVAWGVASGLPVCLALSKLAASSALEVRTFDPVAYAVVPLTLAGVTAASGLIPALRAAVVNPTVALRQE